MTRNIRKAAVLGAGVMGAGIAAQLANAGIPTYLFDLVPHALTAEEERKGLTLQHPSVRNRLAQAGKDRLLQEKPTPLYDQANLELITVGNMEDDLHRLAEADWIIEAVVENLAAKQQLLAQIEPYRTGTAIVSSNTSGVSINELAEGRSDLFRAHFLGTHFFNPPRYMKLLEIIPGQATDPAIVDFMMQFGRRVLGKGTVLCKDTPNFIANRIGTYGVQITIQEMLKLGLGVDEVDELTGPVIGRPKSATFRTLDVVGLDTYSYVTHNVYDKTDDPQEKEAFAVLPLIRDMVAKGWLGQKSGQGFYKQQKTAIGKEILVLDYHTGTYRQRQQAAYASLQAAKSTKGLPQKLTALINGADKGGQFVWTVLKKTLLYAADKMPHIADDITAVDRAMKWGFGWELGPFELWDEIGVAESVARMRREGEIVPAWVEEMLAAGASRFYQHQAEGLKAFAVGGTYKEVKQPKEWIDLAALKAQGKVVRQNSGAALIDLGEGVACLEFTSPNNTLGPDVLQLTSTAVKVVKEHFDGLLIGNQGKNFCLGLNLAYALLEAQDENWLEIELMIDRFHQLAEQMHMLQRPIVAAPFGMTLGGGVEICYLADRVQMAAETYLGLVETGVGLLPGAGGTKEMLFRAMERVPAGGPLPTDPFPAVAQAFETIAMAKVSSSGHDAIKLGYLRTSDCISINTDFLLYDAKQLVLRMAREGYTPRKQRKIRVIGQTGYASLKQSLYGMRESGLISEHDEYIASKIAYVMSGGSLPAGTEVSEKYILQLEKEAFMELIKHPKTHQRMQHMLTKRKPLRN